MTTTKLATLCDKATEAHRRIQQDFDNIDPVVGVTQNMRASGIPADVMMIDCLRTGKRIILVLHDHQPDLISYQFAFKDKDPGDNFEEQIFDQLTVNTLYNWMKDYFLATPL